MGTLQNNFGTIVDTAIENLIKRVDAEIPESGPFETVYEFIDNTDEATMSYVGRYSIYVYNMPESVQPDLTKRYIEVAAYSKDSPYKASMAIACGNNQRIKEFLASPEGRQDVIDSLKTEAEEIR